MAMAAIGELSDRMNNDNVVTQFSTTVDLMDILTPMITRNQLQLMIPTVTQPFFPRSINLIHRMHQMKIVS